VLLVSIVMSIKSLMWMMALLFLIIYIGALIFVQAAADYLGKPGAALDVSDPLLRNFGSIELAMQSLFKSITGGADWGDLAAPFLSLPMAGLESFTYYYAYTAYICFMFFAVLNILTGIFVENAIKTTKQDSANMIYEERAKQKHLQKEMVALFQGFDDDHSGTISMEKFDRHQTNPHIKAYMSHFDIDLVDARELLGAILESFAGEVPIAAFIEGCARLKGSAKRADFVTLTIETKRMVHSFQEFRADTTSRLTAAAAATAALSSQLRCMRAHPWPPAQEHEPVLLVERVNADGFLATL